MKTELEICQDLMEIICQCEIRIIKAKKAMAELTGIQMDDNPEGEKTGLVTEEMWETYRAIFNENMSRVDEKITYLNEQIGIGGSLHNRLVGRVDHLENHSNAIPGQLSSMNKRVEGLESWQQDHDFINEHDVFSRDIEKISAALSDHNLRINALNDLIYTHKNDVSAQLNAQELRLAGGWNKWAAEVEGKLESLVPIFDHVKLNELIESQEKQPTPPPISEFRTCQMCGKKFIPKMKISIYCGKQCSKKNANANQAAKKKQNPPPQSTEPEPEKPEPAPKTINNDEFYAKLEKLKAEAKGSKIIHTQRPNITREL